MSKPVIGFVSLWQNRGQSQVTRHIRDVFIGAGYPTYVLARPSPAYSAMPSLVHQSGVWDIPGLTVASRFDVPVEEYVDWAAQTGINLLFCDMNFQFGPLERLRREGVKVVGRFAWERFGTRHVAPTLRAFDVVYSLTLAEQKRYAQMGIVSPYLRWGVHPELTNYRVRAPEEVMRFFFHGGMLGRRKPLGSTISAFMSVKRDDIRLLIKSQATHKEAEALNIEGDSRITHIQEDLDFDAYQRMLTDCHVCLAPSRWEGLGVHLYEAAAHGMPVIATDMPPVDEVITHGRNGLLVDCEPCGETGAGLTKYEPSAEGLAAAIERIADHREWMKLHQGQQQRRLELTWENTGTDYLALAGRVVF